MISADFYPTQYSQVSGQIELTDSFDDISGYSGASAYWLGYINRDNVPQFRKLTDFEKNYDTSTGILVSASFNPIDTENLDFTYGAWGIVNASKCFSNPQGEVLSMYSSFSPWGYINKCKVGLVRMRTPNFRFMLMVRTGSDGQTWGAPQTIAVDSGFEDNDNNDNGFEAFYEFVKGERTLTKTFAFSDISINIEINANNLNENYYIPVNGESNGVFYDGILFIYRAWFEPTWNLSVPFDASTASVTNGCIHTVGVTDLFDNDGNVYYTGSDWYQMARNEANGPDFFYLHRDTGGNGNIYPTSFGVQNAGLPILTYDNLHYIGGYDFEIGFNNSVWGNANHIIYTNGNIACINQYDNQLFCYTMIRPVDIRYNATLVARYEAGWLPEYDENNCPTGEFFKDSEVNEKGRPWQIDELTDNEYSEDDRPPYNPEPSDDNPTTSGGDDHLPRRGFSIGGTGGFVTQYALSYSQLHEFANMLWAQFGDADFISNIGTTFLNDYSIKPSDILNYIVSMRVYPFNLADSVSYTDTQSNNIFIGRGVFPYILTTGSTHVIADTCETFDGGYCDVPTYYNDFRDYEPSSSIEVYVPYCGSVSISPSEVVGKRLRLTYGVDYSTGALSATLWVISDTNYTLAVLSGQVAASIQMSASNEMDGILRLTSIATTIGKAMLTDDKVDTSKLSDTAKNAAKVSNAIGMTSDLVNSVGSGLPVHSIGNTNGFSNFATPPRACITISYHKYKNPENFAHVYGYKCNRRETLGSLNGYTKCKNVDVSGFTCHEDERSEIKALLESGVYL